ncbi:hypothetical protein PVL29_014696 [Vitis rotundifolia]|uniref:Chloroplast envelope membrane protein n=1 Tax=Vitis rotundifolia TaxID=103349 RepID=A0AA38ZHG8_VITRO|nr:hypothetical protein PVL29_014696 [Vitis rotundifolia]
MSTSMVLCENLIFFRRSSFHSHTHGLSLPQFIDSTRGTRRRSRRRLLGLVHSTRPRRSWWQKFFDDDGNWLGLKDGDMVDLEESSSEEEDLSETQKFEAWKRRAEAILELREAQEDMRNQEGRRWEDWLVEGSTDSHSDSDWVAGSFVESVRDLVLGREDDELLYEDRVFRYASFNSAKFLAVLLIIPWALDFVVHDYVLMPFLDRYVKTVPLAAKMLDVRRHQKLEMVKELKIERARFRLEVEIGKSPPLSDDEVWLELRHKALELRDEWRLENRRAFANIWSDMVFGISLFILLYHSESGWQTLLEVVVEHYGLEVDQSAITIFVCLIPVVIDACVKLWLFKFLPRLSPRVSNIFREMKRH